MQKFIYAFCENRWSDGKCKMACAVTFPDTKQHREAMRDAVKKLIELCPYGTPKFDKKVV